MGSAKLLLCALLIGAGGCSTLNQMAEDAEQRWDDPEAILSEMQKSEPLSLEDQAKLRERIDTAGHALETEDCDEAEPAARQLLSVDPEDMEAQYVIAECLLHRGDRASAKSQFTLLQDRAPNVRATRGLALIAARDGDYDEAQTLFDTAIEMAPDDWRSWNGLGFVEDSLKNWEASKIAYERAGALAPKEGAPFNNLGMSYLQQGKRDQAISMFAEALDREPMLKTAQLNLRIAYALDGDYANALAGASEQERAVVLNNAGVAAMARGEMELARKLFQEALDISPKFYAVAYENLERAQMADD